MTSSPRLRVGVIGCGQVAAVGHFPWYRKNRSVGLVAAADPEEKKLRLAGKLFDIDRLFTEPMEMIESGVVDAVSICSPHWAHFEQVEAAVSRGLHVLCEKPMSVSLVECDRIVEITDGSDAIFQVAHQKRFDWAFQRIRELLESGALGRVFQVGVNWHHYVPDLNGPLMRKIVKLGGYLGIDPARDLGAWRQNDPRTGGGDLMDHGPHYFDLFRYWLGEVESISAEVGTLSSDRIYEDHADVVVRFRGGAMGYFERSDTLPGRPTGREEGHIYGSRGRLAFRVPFEYTNRPAKLYRYGYSSIPLDRHRRIRRPGHFPKSAYQRQIDHFVSRITGRDTDEAAFPPGWAATARDAREAVTMVLASYRSSREGIKIRL